jgi:hypothetical protein
MATKESQNQGNSSTIKLPIGNITSSIQAYQKGGMSLPRIRETLTEKRIGERLLNQAFKALNIPLAKTQPEALPQEKRFVDQPDAEQKIKELLAEGKSELDIIPLIKSLGFNVQGLGKFFSKIAAKSSSKPVVTKSKKTPRNSGFDSGYRPSKTRDGKTVTQLVGEQRGTMPEAKPQENHDQRITAIARELKIPAVGDETKKTKQDKKLEVPATFAGTLTPSQEPKAETKVEPTKVPGNKLPKKTTDGRKVQDILIINYFKKNKDNYSINKIKKALIKSDISKAQIERVITEQVKLNNTQQKVKPETSHKAQREKMSAYINNQRENYGDNGIKNSLLKTGWTEDEISKGFSDAGPRKEAKLIEVKKDVKIGAQSPAKPEAKSEAKPTKEAQKGPAIPIEVSEADANKSIQTNDQKVASKTEEADTTITEEPIDLGNLTNAELDAKGQEIHKKEVAAKLAKETVVKAKTPTPKDNIQTTTVAPKVAPVEKEVTVKPVAEVKTETTTEVAPVKENTKTAVVPKKDTTTDTTIIVEADEEINLPEDTQAEEEKLNLSKDKAPAEEAKPAKKEYVPPKAELLEEAKKLNLSTDDKVSAEQREAEKKQVPVADVGAPKTNITPPAKPKDQIKAEAPKVAPVENIVEETTPLTETVKETKNTPVEKKAGLLSRFFSKNDETKKSGRKTRKRTKKQRELNFKARADAIAELDAKGQEIHKKEVAAKLAKETVVKAKTPTPKDNIQTTTVAPKVAPVEKEVTVKPVAEVKTETTTEVAPVEEVKIEAKPETTNVVEAPKKAKTFEEGVKAGEIDLQPSPETQKKLKELFEKEMTAEEKKAAKERKEKEKTAPTVRLKPLEKEAPAKKVDITEKEENKPVATGRLAWLRSKFGKKAVDKSGLKPVETTAPKTEVVIKPIVDGKNASTVETVEDEPNTSEILEATPIDEKTEDTSDKVAPIKKEGTDIVTPPVTEKKTATKKQAPTRAPHGAGYESHMEALTSSDNLHDGDMGDRQRPTIAKPAAKPTEVAPVEAKAIDPLDAAFAKLKKASEKPPANVAEITKALKVQLSDSEVVPVVEEAKKEVPIKDSTKNVEGKTEVEIKPEDIPSNDRPWDEDLDNEITRVDINPVEKEAEVKPTTKDIDAKKTKETTPEEKTVEPAKKVKAPRRDSHGVKYEAFIDSQIGDNEDIITKPERQRDTAPTTKDIKETTPAKETKKEVDDENETDQVVRGLLDDDAVEETPVDTETEVKAKKEAKPETNGDLEERLDKNQEIAELKQRVTEIEGREKGYISIDKVRDVVTDVVKGAINPEIYKTALLDIKTAKENVTGLDEKSLALKDKLTAVEKKLEKFDAKEYQSHIAQLKTLAKEGYVTRKEGGKITTDLQDYVQNYLTQLDDEDIKKIPVLQSMVTTFKGRAKELKDNIDQQTKALKEFEEKTGNTQTDIYDKVSNQTKAFEKETKAIYAGIKKQERVLAEFGEHILKAYQNLATNTVEKIEMVGGDLETLFDAASNETNNLADQIEGLKNKYHLAIPHKNIVAKGRKILNNLGKGPADPADPTESTGTPMQIYTAEQPSTQIKEKKTLRQYIPLVTQRSGMDGLRGRRVRK